MCNGRNMNRNQTIFAASTTTSSPAKLKAVVNKVRAEAKAYQEKVGVPTKRTKRISSCTLPGAGIGFIVEMIVTKL